MGDVRKAIEFYEQALLIAHEVGDRRGEGVFLGNLGLTYASLGDARKAIEFYEQALVIARGIGDRYGEGNALGNLGVAYKNLGDVHKAIDFYEQQLAIVHEIGDHRGEGTISATWEMLMQSLGDTRKAIEFYEQAMVLHMRSATPRRRQRACKYGFGIQRAWGKRESPKLMETSTYDLSCHRKPNAQQVEKLLSELDEAVEE